MSIRLLWLVLWFPNTDYRYSQGVSPFFLFSKMNPSAIIPFLNNASQKTDLPCTQINLLFQITVLYVSLGTTLVLLTYSRVSILRNIGNILHNIWVIEYIISLDQMRNAKSISIPRSSYNGKGYSTNYFVDSRQISYNT